MINWELVVSKIIQAIEQANIIEENKADAD